LLVKVTQPQPTAQPPKGYCNTNSPMGSFAFQTQFCPAEYEVPQPVPWDGCVLLPEGARLAPGHLRILMLTGIKRSSLGYISRGCWQPTHNCI